jgi:hypothetical protein
MTIEDDDLLMADEEDLPEDPEAAGVQQAPQGSAVPPGPGVPPHHHLLPPGALPPGTLMGPPGGLPAAPRMFPPAGPHLAMTLQPQLSYPAAAAAARHPGAMLPPSDDGLLVATLDERKVEAGGDGPCVFFLSATLLSRQGH